MHTKSQMRLRCGVIDAPLPDEDAAARRGRRSLTRTPKPDKDAEARQGHRSAMTITSLPDIERRLRDVRSVALGGMLLENRPSTLVRALLRSGADGLFLCSAPAASWGAGVLLGAGRVA